jgi:hypothetical protein
MELKDQQYEKSASELFLSLQHIYKDWDYRCLVPDSHKDPVKWRTYDMHGYRVAFDKKTLDEVATFKFDKYFNNWIDPNVFKAFTRNPAKYWKKGHGFPYVKKQRRPKENRGTSSVDCWKKCARLEMSSFARHCKRRGGFFKCCVTSWSLEIFEKTRNQLITDGLLKDKKSNRCKKRQHTARHPCRICNAEALCTTADPDHDKLMQTSKTKYKRQHKVCRAQSGLTRSHLQVGGVDQAFHSPIGLRLSWCQVGDGCTVGMCCVVHFRCSSVPGPENSLLSSAYFLTSLRN